MKESLLKRILNATTHFVHIDKIYSKKEFLNIYSCEEWKVIPYVCRMTLKNNFIIAKNIIAKNQDMELFYVQKYSKEGNQYFRRFTKSWEKDLGFSDQEFLANYWPFVELMEYCDEKGWL